MEEGKGGKGGGGGDDGMSENNLPLPITHRISFFFASYLSARRRETG